MRSRMVAVVLAACLAGGCESSSLPEPDLGPGDAGPDRVEPADGPEGMDGVDGPPASGVPYAGTCLEEPWACFDYAGVCTARLIDGGAVLEVSWDNGAKFTFDNLTGQNQATASDGTTCLTTTPDPQDPSINMYATIAGDYTVKSREGEDTITCPDGTEQTSAPPDFAFTMTDECKMVR